MIWRVSDITGIVTQILKFHKGCVCGCATFCLHINKAFEIQWRVTFQHPNRYNKFKKLGSRSGAKTIVLILIVYGCMIVSEVIFHLIFFWLSSIQKKVDVVFYLNCCFKLFSISKKIEVVFHLKIKCRSCSIHKTLRLNGCCLRLAKNWGRLP